MVGSISLAIDLSEWVGDNVSTVRHLADLWLAGEPARRLDISRAYATLAEYPPPSGAHWTQWNPTEARHFWRAHNLASELLSLLKGMPAE